ncbi:uncharacterized protein LOC115626067 [Scaptodrosophila lebanonensis]|uniref:Uncharacterized protein LOC115626067 n=1 Tax=Drosophila lebanonensis TaxID=7225 RepID=A0A6J2TNT3_DROLE|nr:uncharacterized protein LOC115626067 [Scaptodrosophila lebanonensis]
MGKSTNPAVPKWKETKSISKVLQTVGIKTKRKVAYQTGQYAVVPATFWNLKDEALFLTATFQHYPETNEMKLDISFDINDDCIPQLRMKKCANPEDPAKVDIADVFFVSAIIVEDCEQDHELFTWKVLDPIGLEEFTKCETEKQEWAVPKYVLGFHQDLDLWKNLYTVRLEAKLGSWVVHCHCYINVIMAAVDANIGGGEYRTIDRTKPFKLNGTTSRDFSKPPNVEQFKAYNWKCISWDDYSNRECRKTFPETDDDPERADIAGQVITVSNEQKLDVEIICVSNCENELYNADEKVYLRAYCANCGGGRIGYEWTVGEMVALEQKELRMKIGTNSLVRIELLVRASDGRTGVEIKFLTRNDGPSQGRCTVAPTVGDEYATPFIVCCTGWVDRNIPIDYFYYANNVLIQSCYDCSCESHLPPISKIKVLICDSFFACTERSLDVTVRPAENIPTEPSEIYKFLTTEPHDVKNLFRLGKHEEGLAILSAVAGRVYTNDAAIEVMRMFEDFKSGTVLTLGLLANMTMALAINLSPIDDEEAQVLAAAVREVNENFETITKHDMAYYLAESAFHPTTRKCISTYNMISRLAKDLPRPPKSIYNKFMKGPLSQSLVEELRKEINSIDDEKVKMRSLVWLETNWETERLYEFLDYARKNEMQGDSSLGVVVSEGVSLEEQCAIFPPGKDYEIATSDSMHRVTFEAALLDELKKTSSNIMCLKVISVTRELNWWYPEERQPSSTLLTVRVYQGVDDFKQEVELKRSTISFTTIVGKYKPAMAEEQQMWQKGKISTDMKTMMSLTDDFHKLQLDESLVHKFPDKLLQAQPRHLAHEHDEDELVSDVGKFSNCLESGTLHFLQDVHVFRITLEASSMLAVRFENASHKLRVFLHPKNFPMRSAIQKSQCFVPAGSTNKTILMRNKCAKPYKIYLAIRAWSNEKLLDDQGVHTLLADGPVSYAFVFQLRSCDYWMYSLKEDDQKWSPNMCLPSMKYSLTDGLHCTCTIMSTYTSYVYYVPAIPVPIAAFSQAVTNPSVVTFYIVVMVFLLLWLIVLRIFCNKPGIEVVYCELNTKEKSTGDVHDVLVYIRTGGRESADTSANVYLSFLTKHHTELQFTVYQDPHHPVFRMNSTHCLWLRTRDIRIPTKIAVSHSNHGMRPSWYLRRIEVRDLQTQEVQVFEVRSWFLFEVVIMDWVCGTPVG